MTPDWDLLAGLAELRFRQDAERLAALRREAAELREARTRLDAEGRAAVLSRPVDGGAALAACELWRGWARARRVDLATREAELRAREGIAAAGLRRSFGRREAVAREAARAEAAAAHKEALRDGERLLSAVCVKTSAGPRQRS